MKQSLHRIGLAAVCCAALVIGGAGRAGTSRTTLSVSATVAAIATLAVTAAPTGLTLTPQDIRRGSVTVTEPMVLLIRSNSAQGIALDIRAAATLFSAVSVHGLEGDAMIAGEGGTLTHRWAHAQPLPLALSFTFYLTSAAQAGTYAWPLSLRVRALETL